MSSLLNPLRGLVRESSILDNTFQLNLSLLQVSQGQDRHARYVCEMCVIRLLDSWARFNREVIFLSAGARAVTQSGVRLPLAPNINTRADVLPVLRMTYRTPPRYEPKWAIAAQCIDAAQRLRVQNLGTLSAALGAANSPADELRLVRNFLAHRTEEARRPLQVHPVFAAIRNCAIECTAGMVMAGGVLRFSVWVRGLNAVAQACTS